MDMSNTQETDQEEMLFSQDPTQTTQKTPKEETRKKKRLPEGHTQSGQLTRRNSTNDESSETPRKRPRRNSTGKRGEDDDNEEETRETRESWEARERREAMISEKVEKERRRLEAEERSTGAANQELYQLYNELQGISHE